MKMHSCAAAAVFQIFRSAMLKRLRNIVITEDSLVLRWRKKRNNKNHLLCIIFELGYSRDTLTFYKANRLFDEKLNYRRVIYRTSRQCGRVVKAPD